MNNEQTKATLQDTKSLKLTKKQIEVLYEARRWRGDLPGPLVATVCGDALVRKGLMWHYYGVYGDVWRLTPEGERIAAMIRKDENVIPIRRSA